MLTWRTAAIAVICMTFLALPIPSASRSKGYITPDPPDGLEPAEILTEDEMREDFQFLWNAINVTYPWFSLKSINWNQVRRRYEGRLKTVDNADGFYQLMFELVNELKDAHSGLQNYGEPRLADVAGVTIDLFEGKPFVIKVKEGCEAARAGISPGWEIVSIDGSLPAEKMEALRPYLHALSSERAYRRMAVHRLLQGKGGTIAELKLRLPNGQEKTFSLRRGVASAPGPNLKTFSFQLTRQRYVDFGRHPSGLGYIWIRSFDGKDDVAKEFDVALDQLRETPGLILDIRDNEGGFGQPQIVSRLLKKRTLVAIQYVKTGPSEKDYKKDELHLEPGGTWQYTKGIALLVNEITGSAADLLACQLRSSGRVQIVGSTTHGNLSGVAAFAVLPCGLLVRITNGYVADAKNRIIEMNGNEPDIKVEPTINDFLNGRDPVLDKAVELITKAK
jgi:carboxyl-terminal processing protease